jgi:quinol monooxygenase YgiN
MVVIGAVIRIKKGKNAEFEKEFLKLQGLVLKDPGCVSYAMHRSVDDPTKYFVYEKYASDEAVKYHTSTDHFKAFFSKMGPVMEGQPEINFYQEVV